MLYESAIALMYKMLFVTSSATNLNLQEKKLVGLGPTPIRMYANSFNRSIS